MKKEASMPAVWLVRAGKYGEDEETALSQGLAVIGFREIKDLRTYSSMEEMVQTFLAEDPEGSLPRATNLAAQLWAFRERIKIGDIVVLPLKTRPGQIALGRITGPYEYRKLGDSFRHVRQVKWERVVPRSVFGQDLLYSFGSLMTVCRISRNNADYRVAEVLAGKQDPGMTSTEEAIDTTAIERLDIAQAAHDEIVNFVRERFTGHNLARLIGAILEAEGFKVSVSPPGPDRGVDILAGRGPLGLDEPRLCVQVKATEAPVDVTVVRALQGTMAGFGATQGLLVSWGGFTEAARREARQQAFKIALWDQNDIINAIYRTYDKLKPEIQAELPLKRIWVLVREELEE